MALRILGILLSVSSAIASSLPSQQQSLTAQESNNGTVSPDLFSELEELSRVVDIAYCVGLTGTGIQEPFTCLSRCSEFETFELIKAWNTGPLLSDSCGYIALSHEPAPRRIILAFRGTYSVANTLADLSTVPQEYVPYPGDDDKGGEALSFDKAAPKCENCTVHMGFYASWLNTRNEILDTVEEAVVSYPNYTLTLVGHSLGGAVAALAGLDFISRGWDPVVTTFGEPRIGNGALANYTNSRYNLTDTVPTSDGKRKFRRVTHVDDPVPLLPLEEWGYAMHGGEIHITKSAIPPENGDVVHCAGDADPKCIAGNPAEPTEPDLDTDETQLSPGSQSSAPPFLPGQDEQHVVKELRRRWGVEDVVPPRYRLWQLFFAHRDYFWRLGLCVPTTGWWGDRPTQD